MIRQAGGGWLRGRPADHLRRLVDQYGLEEVLAAVASSPPEHRPPWIVQHAAEILAAGTVARATVPPADRAPVDLTAVKARRAQLAQLVDLYDREAPGSLEAQTYREELQACETELMRLGGTL